MPVGDIRPIKAALREHYKTLRREMPPKLKAQRDRRIADRVTALWQYQRCGQLLTYVSTPIEVDTLEIIRRALAAGKRVKIRTQSSQPNAAGQTMNWLMIIDGYETTSGNFSSIDGGHGFIDMGITDTGSGYKYIPVYGSW